MISAGSLNINTWAELDSSGSPVDGFRSIELANRNLEICGYIFKDHEARNHFAIDISKSRASRVDFSQVTGMTVAIKNYAINGNNRTVIDGICELDEFLEEFTGVLREILILIDEEAVDPIVAVQNTMAAWVSFWSRPNTNLLTVDQQIGLIGELHVLKKLIQINLSLALDCWKGPLGGKFDFSFTDWSFEVKATRSDRRAHTVNGIDQLEPDSNKKLALVSLRIQSSNVSSGLNLSQEIKTIRKMIYQIDKSKTAKFLSLLSLAGYNLARGPEYENFNFEVFKSDFYEVNDEFPRLTSTMLSSPMNPRVELVRYKIVLQHLDGVDLDDLAIGNYFY